MLHITFCDELGLVLDNGAKMIILLYLEHPLYGGDDDPYDDDYDLRADKERALDPKESDVFKQPLKAPQLVNMRQRLSSMAKSIKNKSRRLKDNEKNIND